MERLADDLWTQSIPFRLMGADLRTRMTVIRIGQDLILHSPLEATDALDAELSELGRVRWLLAPCDLHHLGVPSWRARYPDAEVIAAPDAGRRMDGVEVDATLPDGVPDEWVDHVGALFIEGMPRLNETAFYHRPSKTLVLTDFLFNHTSAPGWYTKAFLQLAGAWSGPKQTKLLRSMVKERDKVKAVRNRLLKWDIDRITVCHGDVISENAKAAIHDATRWL